MVEFILEWIIIIVMILGFVGLVIYAIKHIGHMEDDIEDENISG